MKLELGGKIYQVPLGRKEIQRLLPLMQKIGSYAGFQDAQKGLEAEKAPELMELYFNLLLKVLSNYPEITRELLEGLDIKELDKAVGGIMGEILRICGDKLLKGPPRGRI
jgi:hypothetical protein